MPADLADQVFVVAGATGELGRRIADELERRGASTVRMGREPRRPGRVVLGDLADPMTAATAVATALELHGRVDGVVNAAGVVAYGRLEACSDQVLDEVVATDLLGPLRLIRAALPHLEGGVIVNVSDAVAEHPVADMVAYSAAKAGLSAASAALGRELAGQDVRVLDVRPPAIDTGLAQRPIAGAAGSRSQGLAPSLVARRIVDAIAACETDLDATAFCATSTRPTRAEASPASSGRMVR